MTKKTPKAPSPPPCAHVFSQRIDPETLETIDLRWICRYCGLELQP